MPCKIPYCQGTVSFAFQVKWYKYDSSNGVILSAPPSFISALIVKNSILNNFTHMAMNSDPARRANFTILISCESIVVSGDLCRFKLVLPSMLFL